MPIYHMSLFRMPKSVAKRLDKVQRDFLWGGEVRKRKLISSSGRRSVRIKSKGGLGLRKLVFLNKALLGKWVWRFAIDRDDLWKQVIVAKYGQEGLGWRAKKAYGTIGVGVWKEIWKESDWCWDNMGFIECDCGGDVDQNFGQGGWNLRFLRDFNDWEMEMIGKLLHVLRDFKPSMEEDSVRWKGGRNGKFRVKEAYRLVTRPNDIGFPARCIWVDSVPTKVAFYAWEATWGRVLTLDRLQKRGWQLPNCCFLCGCEEETVNHLLIHCIVVRVLWDIVLGLSGMDIKFVFLNEKVEKEIYMDWSKGYGPWKEQQDWKWQNKCGWEGAGALAVLKIQVLQDIYDAVPRRLIVSNHNLSTDTDTLLLEFPNQPLWTNVMF
ncbi:putative ribonuclease H protein [Vitis vinifera]|uniref:Putative ribonuclease H protein n=1 Tax=Vitis vinifera TaxID=29760 RepID=A0A438DRV6_VITVI|nr:putative ribonuclease H protein [Vitis vinifera]